MSPQPAWPTGKHLSTHFVQFSSVPPVQFQYRPSSVQSWPFSGRWPLDHAVLLAPLLSVQFSSLSSIQSSIVSDNSRLCDTLRGNHPHALWRILRHACNSQFTHWMPWNYVTDTCRIGAAATFPGHVTGSKCGGLRTSSRTTSPCSGFGCPSVLGVAACGRGGRCRCGVCRGSVAHRATLDPSFDEWFGASGAGLPRLLRGPLRHRGVQRRRHRRCGSVLGTARGHSRLRDECMSAFSGCRDGQSVAQLGTGPLSVPIQDSGFGFETKGQMKITCSGKSCERRS